MENKITKYVLAAAVAVVFVESVDNVSAREPTSTDILEDVNGVKIRFLTDEECALLRKAYLANQNPIAKSGMEDALSKTSFAGIINQSFDTEDVYGTSHRHKRQKIRGQEAEEPKYIWETSIFEYLDSLRRMYPEGATMLLSLENYQKLYEILGTDNNPKTREKAQEYLKRFFWGNEEMTLKTNEEIIRFIEQQEGDDFENQMARSNGRAIFTKLKQKTVERLLRMKQKVRRKLGNSKSE